jgi:hypothetical protein
MNANLASIVSVFAASGTGGSGNNTIAEILKNVRNSLGVWGGIIISILGAAAIIVAAYMIVKGLMSHGKGQPTNWLIVIGLIVIGGLFVTIGFGGFASITQTGDANKILNGQVEFTEGDTNNWVNGGGGGTDG